MSLFRRADQGEQVDDKAGQTRRVRRLGERIKEARNLRCLVRDPDLRAVEMERQGRRTLARLWLFLALGLVYTTTGVQEFLAKGTTRADPMWWAAWCVEPMFAGLLVTLLNFEAVILSYGIKPAHEWWTRLKTVLLGSTLGMNVIPQLEPLIQGRWGSINLGSLAVHAIIPLIVFGIAEVIPVIQARQREVILRGYQIADEADTSQEPAPRTPPRTAEAPPASNPPPPPEEHGTPEAQPVSVPAPPPAPPSVPETVRKGPKLPAHMMSKVDEAYQRAVREGREFTAADIQEVIKIPAAMAEQLAANYNVHNGHEAA